MNVEEKPPTASDYKSGTTLEDSRPTRPSRRSLSGGRDRPPSLSSCIPLPGSGNGDRRVGGSGVGAASIAERIEGRSRRRPPRSGIGEVVVPPVGTAVVSGDGGDQEESGGDRDDQEHDESDANEHGYRSR